MTKEEVQMTPGLHTAAIDYYRLQSQETSDRLIAASLRASIAELRGTGEIVPREALLLLTQLAEEYEDPSLPSSDDDDEVCEPTGILRLAAIVPAPLDEF